MRPLGRAALALALALAACDKPRPADPAEQAYHRAMELFAKASAASHDLTYRDPRFDEVLAALAKVPLTDPLRDHADELARKIVAARAEANRADQDSKAAVSQALETPPFNPVPRDVPLPPATKPAVAAAAPTANPSEMDNLGGGIFSPTTPERKLPDWYRRAGYFGGRPGSPPGVTGPPRDDPNALGPPQPATEAVAANPAPPPPSSNATPDAPPPPQGPPPIFGLPGPAGRALVGH